MDKKRFQGERLKSARMLRGITLAALQDLTGISKQSISLYENCLLYTSPSPRDCS